MDCYDLNKNGRKLHIDQSSHLLNANGNKTEAVRSDATPRRDWYPKPDTWTVRLSATFHLLLGRKIGMKTRLH